MLKLTLNNPHGQTETVDLSVPIGEIISRFQKSGIRQSPFYYRIKDARQETSPIRIHSDSDFGSGAWKLLRDEDTVYDAYVLDQVLYDTREEIREELEQKILYEQYENTEELYEDIRLMTKALGSEQVSFYCPLESNQQDVEEDRFYETDSLTLLANSDKISEHLKKEQARDMNKAEYVGDHAKLSDKLVYAEWSVEELDGTLYGKIDCHLTEPLTAEETERLRDAILGQNSDGFGKGFEQREIPIEDGTLNVSFGIAAAAIFYIRRMKWSNTSPGKTQLCSEVRDELL